MKRLTTILLTGITALAFTACGSSGSSTGGTTPPPVEPIDKIPPIGPNGNIKLLPGYKYECWHVDRYEFYVSKRGYVIFDGDTGSLFFDSNYNVVPALEFEQLDEFAFSIGPFDPGQYYMETSFCGWHGGGDGSFIVQSDVLY